MNEDEIYSQLICARPGCYNFPERGYVYCVTCLYGSPNKAPAEAIAWKKKKEGLED